MIEDGDLEPQAEYDGSQREFSWTQEALAHPKWNYPDSIQTAFLENEMKGGMYQQHLKTPGETIAIWGNPRRKFRSILCGQAEE